MRVVVCPDSFKGSVLAEDAACAIESGLRRVLSDIEVTRLPMADGGEGTGDALVRAAGGLSVLRTTWDPLSRPCTATLRWISKNRAIVELADASGYNRLTDAQRTEQNALRASTYGTGRLIKDALDAQADEIYLTLGGSATSDAGYGIFGALGGIARDKNGLRLSTHRAETLADVHSLDVGGLHPRLREVTITVACDVDNPLCDVGGAAFVYGPQKGLTPGSVAERDGEIASFASLVERVSGLSGLLRGVPGLGAAGGAALPLVAFANARLVPGAVLVAEAVFLEAAIANADLVVTGEGSFDEQSMHGKVVAEVARLARKHQKPCAVIAGRVDDAYLDPKASGVAAVMEASPRHASVEEISQHSKAWLEEAAARFLDSFWPMLSNQSHGVDEVGE